MAGPVTYRADGEQYVAVLAGYGGSMGMATASEWMRRPPPNGGVRACATRGTARLTARPPIEPRPATPLDETCARAQVAQGQPQRFAFCTISHNRTSGQDLMR